MENQLENKVSMFVKVETCLANHTADTASIPLIAACKTELSANLVAIFSKGSIAELDITGFTVEKQDKRTAATKTALTISRALWLLGTTTANKGLIEKFDVSKSTIEGKRDADFYMFILGVKDAAAANTAALLPFNITPTIITQLNTEITAYYNVLQKPQDQISERSTKLEEINTLAENTMLMFTTKLDIALSLFQFSNPSLYTLYQNARSIDSTSGTTQPDYEGTIAQADIKLIATIGYLPSRFFRVKNTGNTLLVFALSNNTTPQGTPINILAGQETENIASQTLNADNNANNLLLSNQDNVQEGSYKIYIQE